jgi:hypothetical protein
LFLCFFGFVLSSFSMAILFLWNTEEFICFCSFSKTIHEINFYLFNINTINISWDRVYQKETHLTLHLSVVRVCFYLNPITWFIWSFSQIFCALIFSFHRSMGEGW